MKPKRWYKEEGFKNQRGSGIGAKEKESLQKGEAVPKRSKDAWPLEIRRKTLGGIATEERRRQDQYSREACPTKGDCAD